MLLDRDTISVLVVGLVFGICAMLLMGARLAMRRIRHQPFHWSDYLTMLAVLCLLGRTISTTIALVWGTNVMPDSFRVTHEFSAQEIYQREAGSRLMLAGRACYNTYLWIHKSVVLLFYLAIQGHIPWPAKAYKGYFGVLLATFIGIHIASFLECRPFRLYYQVTPSPGSCSKALRQLFAIVFLDIVTNIMLIIPAILWLLNFQPSTKHRLLVFTQLFLAILLIAIAIIHIPFRHYISGPLVRSTWESSEVFISAILAHAPTIFSLRHRDQMGGGDHLQYPSPPRETYSYIRSPRRWSFRRGITVRNSVELRHDVMSPRVIRQMFPQHQTYPRRQYHEFLVLSGDTRTS
ncbi:hypothetical protein AJ80_01809 [Polytolypa hystricis UAMH7299]|uniref:Rhodopsin domain-containing protein n=1 Tax=Polytolypa hystricis (strain UAMH7299) TaxID=1447883 RepID=A0A2B7YYU9_POLH7|nr:hypothetical protein AJ80_01809 [Polytolypa hystricis UAMH7299]